MQLTDAYSRAGSNTRPLTEKGKKEGQNNRRAWMRPRWNTGIDRDLAIKIACGIWLHRLRHLVTPQTLEAAEIKEKRNVFLLMRRKESRKEKPFSRICQRAAIPADVPGIAANARRRWQPATKTGETSAGTNSSHSDARKSRGHGRMYGRLLKADKPDRAGQVRTTSNGSARL